MPLDDLQKSIFRILAGYRSSESYVAGAIVLHAAPDSPRFSEDIDLFHPQEELVAKSFERDCEALLKAGFQVSSWMRTAGFIQADVTQDGKTMRLDWAHDSAFRFYPLEDDAVLGSKLSLADTATNKVLAAVGRDKPRDILDLLYLDQIFLPLAYLLWAACGKDEGYTPSLICSQLRWHNRYKGPAWDGVKTVLPVDPVAIKQAWTACIDRAEQLCLTFPPDDIGCFYVREDGRPFAPDSIDATTLRHFGSVFGAWPRPVEGDPVPEEIRAGADARALELYPKKTRP